MEKSPNNSKVNNYLNKMERDQRAQGILMKSVKGSLIPYIEKLDTSKEIKDKMVTSLKYDLHKLKVSKDKGLSS